jgi:hypothetical protein
MSRSTILDDVSPKRVHGKERHVIACNYAVDCKTATKGALAYVTLMNPGNGNLRIEILSRSRGGRWIVKWERIDRLTNFRLKTIVPGAGRLYTLAKRCVETYDDVIKILQQTEVNDRIGRMAGMRPALYRGGFVVRGTPYDE